MRSPRKFSAWFLAVLAAVLLLIAPASQAATVVNGDFETGNLSGWQVYNSTPEGNWFAYSGTKTPLQEKSEKEAEEEKEIIIPRPPFFAPPQGSLAAVSDEEFPDTAILYQDLPLEPYWAHQLTMTAYYRSFEPILVPNPNTLAVSPKPGPEPTNQQMRVDVMKPTAPIESLNPSDILATVFANKSGDPESMGPTQLTADLTPFAGQTVRLRVAVSAGDSVFNGAVDAVSITSTPPNNVFKKGKLKLNKAKGTATLMVTIPGAGVLTLTDAGATKKATASKKKAKLVKSATVKPTTAGTVKVPLKPTTAGKKILMEKGKLKIKASLTFTPTGGIAGTQSFKGTLKMK
jgi:hypothetical protein